MESVENKELVNEMVRQLKAEMRTREVRFRYTKKNGEIREALGTLNSEIYGSENEPSGNGKPTPENQVRYYDLNSNGWRSFLAENLIDFKDNDMTLDNLN